MLYLGNDVVDLKDGDNAHSAANPRFAARVLTAAELQAPGDSPGSRWLWACWSAKEAAYKALSRHDAALPFVHREFHVTADALSRAQLLDEVAGTASGVVHHGQHHLPVTWQWTADWVHCVVGAAHSTHRVRLLPDACDSPLGAQTSTASTAVRALAQLLLDNAGVHDVRIERRRILKGRAKGRLGPPCLTRGGAPVQDCTISLSHDGRFVAAAVASG